MVKAPKCKFRIKVGKEYTYDCGGKQITFTNKEFEEQEDNCSFFKQSLQEATKNKANPCIIDHLKGRIKECETYMNGFLEKRQKCET